MYFVAYKYSTMYTNVPVEQPVYTLTPPLSVPASTTPPLYVSTPRWDYMVDAYTKLDLRFVHLQYEHERCSIEYYELMEQNKKLKHIIENQTRNLTSQQVESAFV